MGKRKVFSIIVAAVILTLVLLGFLLPANQSGSSASRAQGSNTAMNLGITYLPVTAAVVEYYDLAVKSGALVTEVVPGSPAEEVGLKPGDVILSFNGTRLEERVTLLGMIMSTGSRASLEICRGNDIRTVELDCAR